MIQDLLALPVTGGVLITGAAYAALSVFVTGPLVAERTIEKSGWPARCARLVLDESSPDTALGAPIFDCGALLGMIYGKEGAAFCERYGAALSSSIDLVGSVRMGRQDSIRTRIAQEAAVESRCVCATRTVIEHRRVDFALHAGSARLVTPLAVRALDAELTRAAQAPACAAKE